MADRDEKPTKALDPRTITGPSWAFALATLEQIKPYATRATKLGLVALLLQCAREMAEVDASPSLIDEAEGYLKDLRRMPWEVK